VSEILSVEARLLAMAQLAVPGLTVGDREIPLEKLVAGQLPYAYVTGWAKRGELGDLGSEDRILEGGLVVVSEVSLEDARAKADAIEARIVADRTLAGLVSTASADVEAGYDPTSSRAWAVLAVRAVVRDGSSATAGGPLVRWVLTTRVRLRAALTGGTTAAAYRTAIASAIATLLSGTRFASDLEDPPLEAVPASSTRFQLAMIAGEITLDANTQAVEIAVRLRVFHRGAAGDSERDYTEGAMAVETATLLRPSWWALAYSDVEVDEDDAPEIAQGDVARA
jgi:hypothetical protein